MSKTAKIKTEREMLLHVLHKTNKALGDLNDLVTNLQFGTDHVFPHKVDGSWEEPDLYVIKEKVEKMYYQHKAMLGLLNSEES
jgi:hypothetical protein